MKLQINQRGAWRDVIEFEPNEVGAVQEAVVPLARTIGTRAAWRITQNSRTGVAYLEAPKFKWRKAL